jgi:hypothetical protein
MESAEQERIGREYLDATYRFFRVETLIDKRDLILYLSNCFGKNYCFPKSPTPEEIARLEDEFLKREENTRLAFLRSLLSCRLKRGAVK